METLDMNANRLQTEERKIQWLENEIKELEYVLSSDCINRNNKLCRLQMYRELLAIKRELKNEMHWHKYTTCGDAPYVKEYQKETFLCKVQRFAKDNEEPIGAPSYQVCVCDDNGTFFGMQGSSDLCWAEVVAWTDIVPTTIGDTADSSMANTCIESGKKDAMCSKKLSSENRAHELGNGWRLTKDRLPEDDNPVAIWPSFHGSQFAVWNKACDCWDDESGDDYLCDKDAVEKWYPINWDVAE